MKTLVLQVEVVECVDILLELVECAGFGVGGGELICDL